MIKANTVQTENDLQHYITVIYSRILYNNYTKNWLSIAILQKTFSNFEIKNTIYFTHTEIYINNSYFFYKWGHISPKYI